MPDGISHYVGTFKDDQCHGTGTLTFANGDRYIGDWSNNTMHGHGTYEHSNGEKFEGEWRNGCWYEGDHKKDD